MGFVDGVNRLILLLMDTLRQLFSGRIWIILLSYFALQWLILYAHFQFMSPAFGWLASITLQFQDPPRAAAFTHYPAHLVLLPGVFGWAKFAFGALFEGLVLGMVAAEFLRRFRSPNTRTSSGTFFGLWINLTIVWLVFNGVALALGEFVPDVLASMLYSPKRIALFTFVVMPALFTVCAALFFYAIPIVVATRRSAFYALGRALTLCIRNPITTLALTGFVIAGPVLIAAISGAYATTIVDKFRPELVYWLLVLGIFVEMISAFFWMGAASRFLTDESV
jgi:hypothetical protein